jgi:beta-phosphoglucomutase-like phosphatase (HAD superfamily)
VIQAVIFDVDGTLVDTVDLHAAAWVETFRRFGVDADFQEVRGQIGKGGDQMMPVIAPQSVVDAHGQEMEAFRSDLYKREYLPRATAFPGVRALFERLKADGLRVAIGSSCKADELGTYLKLAHIEGLPDAATTGDDAEHTKPFPDIFRAAFDKLQPLDRSEVAVVGDSPFDAQAAIVAGFTPVGVLCGGFPESVLRAAGCVEIHAGPEALLAAYDRSILGRKEAA